MAAARRFSLDVHLKDPSKENEVVWEAPTPPDKFGAGSRIPPPASSAELGRSGNGRCCSKASEKNNLKLALF